MKLFSVIILLAIVCIAGISLAHPLPKKLPTGLPNITPKKVTLQQVVGWIPYWDQDAAINSFKQHSDLVDTIIVFWFALLQDGSIGAYPYANIDPSIIDYAHQQGVKVLTVIANLPTEDETGDWDYTRVQKVIAAAPARRQHITDIVNLIDQYQLDGVNIDYEALKAYQQNDFTLFIKELSDQLHAQGKILGVSLHAKSKEADPQEANGSEAQDWIELSKWADHMYIMAYDEHWETSTPGPIASLPWITNVLSYATQIIPSHKLFAGVPLYGYVWDNTEKAQGLTHEAITKKFADDKTAVKWDYRQQSPYATNKNYIAWFENSRSTQAKIDRLTSLGVANIAFWRLGGEDQQTWAVVRQAKFND